jgi:hypothetical protein
MSERFYTLDQAQAILAESAIKKMSIEEALEAIDECILNPEMPSNPHLNCNSHNNIIKLEVYNSTGIVATISAFTSNKKDKAFCESFIVYTHDLTHVTLQRTIHEKGCSIFSNKRFVLSYLEANFGLNLTTNIDHPNQ